MAGFLAWKCPSTAYGYALYSNTIHGVAQIEDVCSWFFQIKFVQNISSISQQYKYCFFLHVVFVYTFWWLTLFIYLFFSNFSFLFLLPGWFQLQSNYAVYYGLMTTILWLKLFIAD